MASILHVLVFTEVPRSAVCKGRIYLICLKLTNPLCLEIKQASEGGGKVPSLEMIRCRNIVSFEPYFAGQIAIDVVPVVT